MQHANHYCCRCLRTTRFTVVGRYHICPGCKQVIELPVDDEDAGTVPFGGGSDNSGPQRIAS
jgi:hypothetical protein